jgi:hypothetical protein
MLNDLLDASLAQLGLAGDTAHRKAVAIGISDRGIESVASLVGSFLRSAVVARQPRQHRLWPLEVARDALPGVAHAAVRGPSLGAELAATYRAVRVEVRGHSLTGLVASLAESLCRGHSHSIGTYTADVKP